MRSVTRAALAAGVLSAACASGSPAPAPVAGSGAAPAATPATTRGRTDLQLEAARTCESRNPSVRVEGLSADGRPQVTTLDAARAEGFWSCYRAETRRLFLGSPGRVVAPPGVERVTVPVRVVGGQVLVPAHLDGQPVTLVVVPGSEKTLVRPEAAARAGLAPADGAVRLAGRDATGRESATTLVRARTLTVGEVGVEGLDVGVVEPGDVFAVRDGGATVPVDGILGRDFFTFLAPRVEGETLTLEVLTRP